MTLSREVEMISVIVPIHNGETYLESCLSSIINQEVADIEIILVDDGSTDNSLEACYKYAMEDSRIIVISQTNKGVSAARNIGIENAKGDYIFFIDVDDEIKPDTLKYMLDLSKINEADVVTANYAYLSVEDRNKKSKLSDPDSEANLEIMKPKKAITAMLYQTTVESGPVGKLFKRQLIGKDRFAEDITIAEDLEFNVKIMINANRIVQTTRKLYLYYQHNGSTMKSSFSIKRLTVFHALKNIRRAIDNDPELIKALNRRYFVDILSILVNMYPARKKYPNEYSMCAQELKKYRNSVIMNPRARSKHRLAALLSYLGVSTLIDVYNIKNTLS